MKKKMKEDVLGNSEKLKVFFFSFEKETPEKKKKGDRVEIGKQIRKKGQIEKQEIYSRID